MDMKKFSLLDWVEKDLITFKRISTSHNYADSLTKAVPKELHYRHNDYLLGKIKPQYCQRTQQKDKNELKDTPINKGISTKENRNVVMHPKAVAWDAIQDYIRAPQHHRAFWSARQYLIMMLPKCYKNNMKLREIRIK